MKRIRLKKLEREMSTKEDLIPPIFVDRVEDKLVLPRNFMEALGYSTEDLKTPEENGTYWEVNDTLCLVPGDHKALERDGSYLYYKGIKGRSIIT